MDLKDFLSQKQLEQLKKINIESKYIIKPKENYFKKPKSELEINREKYKTIIDYLYSC
jgi:hypothetical protein